MYYINTLVLHDAAEAALTQVRGHACNPYADCDHVPYGQIFHYAPAEFDELRRSRPPCGRPGAGPRAGADRRAPAARRAGQPLAGHPQLPRRRAGGANRYPELFDEIHQTLKTGLMIGLATADTDFAYTSDLCALAAQLPSAQAARVHDLLPPARLRELTAFRLASEYEWDPGRRPWPAIDVGELLAAVQQTCGWLAAEALAFTGKSPRDAGYKPCDKTHPDRWDADGPLGGWESLPLDYFAEARTRARPERRPGPDQRRGRGRPCGDHARRMRPHGDVARTDRRGGTQLAAPRRPRRRVDAGCGCVRGAHHLARPVRRTAARRPRDRTQRARTVNIGFGERRPCGERSAIAACQLVTTTRERKWTCLSRRSPVFGEGVIDVGGKCFTGDCYFLGIFGHSGLLPVLSWL